MNSVAPLYIKGHVVTFVIKSNDFRDGKYIVTNVGDVPAWGDVKVVVEHRKHDGTLSNVVNHREKDFAQVEKDLEELTKQYSN